jgi:hypothetical protein
MNPPDKWTERLVPILLVLLLLLLAAVVLLILVSSLGWLPA